LKELFLDQETLEFSFFVGFCLFKFEDETSKKSSNADVTHGVDFCKTTLYKLKLQDPKVWKY
jgi:hypothetical protein